MLLLPTQAMPAPVGAVLGVMGLLLFALGVRDVTRGLRGRLGRPTPIGDLTADAGRVVVSGIARRADEVLEAPLSGEPCLAYAWREAELRTQAGFDGRIDTWGQRGAAGRGAVPFLVEDDTGRLLVDPTGATLRLGEEWIEDPVRIPGDRPEPSTLRDVADQLLRIETHGRRYYESRLEDGETVTVRGRAAPDADRDDDRRRDLGVLVEGTLVADATPGGATARSVRQGAISAIVGLVVLLVAGALSLPSLA